jgi:RHS repeat-associated protein
LHGTQSSQSGNDYVQAYSYDRYGNRTIDPPNPPVAGINYKQFTVDANTNRLGVPSGQTGTMNYDQAGNLTFDSYSGEGARTYDAENRMTGAQASLPATYSYDGDGRRIKRNVNGVETWQVYGLGGELVAEYAANAPYTSPQKEYGYRNGELLITAEAGSVGAGPQSVVWTNAVGVSVSGNTITKTASGGWGNAGAVSTQAIASGNGYVEFTAAQYLVDRICGLSNGDSNQSYDDIDFGILLSDGGYIYVYESGVLKANAGPYATSDTLRVAIEAGQVKYYKNGTVFYTSTATPTYPLIVDTAIYSNGASISNVMISGDSAVNVALATNGATASASSIYWSQAPASNAINGDHVGSNSHWADGTSFGYPDWIQVDFAGSKTINEIDVFGLQENYSNPVEPTLTMTSRYALTNFEVQYWDGSAWATVSGGSVTGNDKVWKKFTFSPLTTSKIRVHVTNVAGDNHSQVVEVEAWTPASGGSSATVKWLVADHLGTPRMIFDQTGSLANVSRHDYLPFGEELFAEIGGRTPAQGYPSGPNAIDGARQKFTSKERDNETGLDYFLARYYSSSQGRFTSADEPFADQRQSNPQSWNSYSYVKNSPCNNIDPNGKCSVPSGLSPGSVGICIEAFIAAPRMGPLGYGRGDNRTFSGDDPKLTARIRVELIIKPESHGTASIQESTQAAKSRVDAPLVPGDYVIEAPGTAKTDITDAKTDKNGTTTFTSTTTGETGFAKVPVIGPAASPGTIDINLNVVVTKDGKVGLNEGGASKNYPSYAVYSYRYDDKGNLITKEIFRREEHKLNDLSRPMVPIPKTEPK